MKVQSIEDAIICLEHVRNMLQLFEEHMDGELTFLEKDGDAVARRFVSRYDLLRSQMDMVEYTVTDIARGLSGLKKEGIV